MPKLAALPAYVAHDDAAKDPQSPSEQPDARPKRILGALTVSAGAVLAVYSVPTTTALGISSAIFGATGLVLFETAVWSVEDDGKSFARISGPLSRRGSLNAPTKEQQLAALRDTAAVLTIVCGVVSWLTEPSIYNVISWEPVYNEFSQNWRTVSDYRLHQQILWMIPVNISLNILVFFIVSERLPSQEHSKLPMTF